MPHRHSRSPTFQATRPHGARHEPAPTGNPPAGVSSHAPARGATFRLRDEVAQHLVSSHAPARGATPAPAYESRNGRSFKPRARTGRDDDGRKKEYQSGRFKPRARTGRDVLLVFRCFRLRDVSSHAPARGATLDQRCVMVADDVSSHAPARGATPLETGHRLRRQVSSHAPARGATGQERDLGMATWFQATRPHGARHAGSRVNFRSLGVSSHAPARGATPTF